MPYSEADLERIEFDSVLRRQYLWQCGQKALLRARQARRRKQWDEADIEESFGRAILDNIDVIVETTGSETDLIV